MWKLDNCFRLKPERRIQLWRTQFIAGDLSNLKDMSLAAGQILE